MVGLFWVVDKTEVPVSDRTVTQLLAELGEVDASKNPDFSISGVSATAGEKLVKEGFAIDKNGNKSKNQSKHFKCISCHNVVKEDIDLADPEPQARLEYTARVGIPYLQGTTLYGAVNRSTYYNGDYEKKYGDLVKPARHDIREAIKLCAVECAQGRDLETWEVESILAYLWDIELKVTDLIFSADEVKLLESNNPAAANSKEKIDLLKSKYDTGADAHFVVPPFDRKVGYPGLQGNPSNGRLIYENSCLYCHENQKYSYLHLDNTKLSFKHLDKKVDRYHPHSLYQVTRWGVPVKSGKRSYMPQYTEEKMSNQQLEDLRAYVHYKATN